MHDLLDYAGAAIPLGSAWDMQSKGAGTVCFREG